MAEVELVVMEHMIPHMLLVYVHVLFVADIVVQILRHVLVVIQMNQTMVVQKVDGDGSVHKPAILLELLAAMVVLERDIPMVQQRVIVHPMLLIMQELVEMVEMVEVGV